MIMAGNHISAFMSQVTYYNHLNCSENGELHSLDTSDLQFSKYHRLSSHTDMKLDQEPVITYGQGN